MFFPVLLSPPPPRHTYFLYPVSVDGRCFIPFPSRLFSPSRLGKRGQIGPLSPPRSTGDWCRPAIGATPVCLTIRTSMIRCPPTRQRVPTWGGTEDRLLLEGTGGGEGIQLLLLFLHIKSHPDLSAQYPLLSVPINTTSRYNPVVTGEPIL